MNITNKDELLGQLHILGVRSNVVDTIIACIYEDVAADVEKALYTLEIFARAFASKFHEHPIFTLSSVKQEAVALYAQLSLALPEQT